MILRIQIYNLRLYLKLKAYWEIVRLPINKILKSNQNLILYSVPPKNQESD